MRNRVGSCSAGTTVRCGELRHCALRAAPLRVAALRIGRALRAAPLRIARYVLRRCAFV